MNRLSFNESIPSEKKKQAFGLNAGSSSILLIFVVLCMVSFATLSIVSANADRKLSDKVLNRTSAYYAACNAAEETLANLDDKLCTVYKEVQEEYNDLNEYGDSVDNELLGDNNASAAREAYFNTVGRNKSYTIEISDLQVLQVSIEILYPVNESSAFYQITSWQVINTVQ